MNAPFQLRAVDRPTSIRCSTCGNDIPLPATEPWLTIGDEARPPELVSFRCPHCRRRIYLNVSDEPDRARDEAADAINDEE